MLSLPITRRSFGVVLAGAAAFFDLYAPQAVLPQIAADLGVSLHQIGWVITVTTLAVAAIGPFAGALADVVGRKRLIVAGALALVVPTLLAATAATFPQLLVWRAAAGLLMPLIFCVTIAYIGEEWDAGEARAMTALYMAGAVAGGFSGRFVCGLIADAMGWRVAFASLGVVNLAIGIGLLFLLQRERSFQPGRNLRAVLAAMLVHLRRPDMLAACIVGLLILFAQVALFTYANLLLAGHPYDLRPGLLAAVSAVYLLGMVTTPIAGSRLRRFRESVPLSVGSGMFIAGIALTLVPALWAIVAGMALASAGTFLSQSAATSFVAASAPEARSAAVGLYTCFYYVGGSIGAVVPGAAWYGGGWPAVAALLSIASLLALVTAVTFWRPCFAVWAAPKVRDERQAGCGTARLVPELS
ncbi:MAG: MFS transporter [Rhodospirillales bacterium]|nr:MFS transporter [Rhodospirillales bacterium]